MARAAVISLMNTIKDLTDSGNPLITSAYDEVMLLEDVLRYAYYELMFLEFSLTRFHCSSSNNSSSRSLITNQLDAEIGEAVRNLEEHMLRHCVPDVKQEMESILETIKNLRADCIESPMIGLWDQFNKVREELLREENYLKTVSLFGMAGIGKTHLAREIYHLPITNEKFVLRVWVTLGPTPRTENVLKDIAAQIKYQLRNQYMKDDTISLSEHIRKNLFGRSYFIVLDDIWSCQAWIDLKMCFPTERRGSRVLLTTRLEEVAKYPTTNSSLHEMRFLKQEESWNLLCRNVFGEDIGPPELEEAGRKIAEQCEGLPLLILEVAHLLFGGKMDPEYWIKVADKQNGIFTDAYEKISEVLLSSYEYLPQNLKACFLYMVVFPQNYEIPLPKLINLWIAENFLKPNDSQTLEDVAVECLAKLVSQSLVIVRKHSSNDTIKSSKLHSTYWHLCVVEARKNKFLHVLNCYNDCSEESIESQHRLSVQNNVLIGIKQVHDSMAATLTARSLLCTGQDHQFPVPICSDMKLLQVLDALALRFYEFPYDVLYLLELKYLSLTHNGQLPPSISKLQKLQSLIVREHHNIKRFRRESSCLPKEIWDMQELRHLQIMGSNLPDPSGDAQLPNLLTLYVKGQSCTHKVFRSTPKLKKLGIKIDIQPRSSEILNCFEHISILQELESLKCVVVNPRLRSQVVAPPDPVSSFPKSLKKLSLNGLGYSWEHMSLIGSLPNLQVLKLRCSAFRGPEWKTKAKEFQMLEFLLLEDIDLVHWTTDDDDDCFSSLKRLIIRHCYKLVYIPPRIGEISTLEMMEVFDCNPSVVASANQIKQDEEDNGNYYLQVPVSSSWDL